MRCVLTACVLLIALPAFQVSTIIRIKAQPSGTAYQKHQLPEYLTEFQNTRVPVLSDNGTRLYFDRKRHPQNTGGVYDPDEIWYSIRGANGVWGRPVNAGKPLNTPDSDVLFSISPDDNFALVYGIYDIDNSAKIPGFSIAFRSGTDWGAPIPLRIEDYYNYAPVYYGYLAPDGRTLLLSVKRENSLGKNDLYVAFKIDSSNVWTAPLHLGDGINTERFEGSPYLASDRATLYFSSDGHGGSGATDLFMTRRLDETWQSWSAPVNLGELINSKGEDSSISLTIEGDTAYFVSTDTTEKIGLFYASLPDSLRPGPSALLEGVVTSYDPLSHDDLIEITAFKTDAYGKRTIVADAFTTIALRDFALALPIGERYVIQASLPPYQPLYHEVDYRNANGFIRDSHSFIFGADSSDTAPIAILYFESGQSEIPDEYRSALTNVFSSSEKFAGYSIVIVGHTDDVGAENSNLQLSRRRAETTRRQLERYGLMPAQLKVEARGESAPRIPLQTKDARSENRRVEIFVRKNRL